MKFVDHTKGLTLFEHFLTWNHSGMPWRPEVDPSLRNMLPGSNCQLYSLIWLSQHCWILIPSLFYFWLFECAICNFCYICSVTSVVYTTLKATHVTWSIKKDILLALHSFGTPCPHGPTPCVTFILIFSYFHTNKKQKSCVIVFSPNADKKPILATTRYASRCLLDLVVAVLAISLKCKRTSKTSSFMW